jgi:uncharacterized protein (TIGR00255 family)
MTTSYALKSMTAFAHAAGYSAPFYWAWEIKAVNAKGLDARVRLGAGFDALESDVRARVAQHITRGTVYINLSISRDARDVDVRINEQALRSLITALENTPRGALAPASLDGLLAIKGIVDVVEVSDNEDMKQTAQKQILAGLDEALTALVAMRAHEGQALAHHLIARIARIEDLTIQAEQHPARQVAAIKARLAQTIEELMSTHAALDPQRLHQEAVILAAKADVREELDRLKTHCAAVRALLILAQPVGRKLDFLAQELAREANTFCAKSNDAALTALGMDMRVEIEQFREQVQNIE